MILDKTYFFISMTKGIQKFRNKKMFLQVLTKILVKTFLFKICLHSMVIPSAYGNAAVAVLCRRYVRA